MMIKLFDRKILILAILFLAACSSTKEKEESSDGQKFEYIKPATTVDLISREDEPKIAVPEKKQPTTDYYLKFSQAMKSKQYKEAINAAGEILARNPKDEKVLNGLSVMAIDQGKYDLARMHISKIFALNPQNAAAYNNLGYIELKSDNLRLALANFKKSVEIQKGNKAAHANLGTIYLQYRNYPAASDELQLAVNNGDESVSTLTNLGFALKGLGKYKDAESVYEKALTKDGANPGTLLNYATLLVENTKDNAKALKILNKLRFIAKEPGMIEKVNALTKKAEAK